MDPNETLRRIRELYVPEGAKLDPEGNELSDLIHRLDEHLTAGGTPPEEWREGPDAVGEDSAGSGAALSRMAMGRDDDYRPDAPGGDDGYPWCSICRKVFGKGQERERDEHLRTAHRG